MNLSEPFIRRPVMTTLVVMALAFFGITAYRALPISSLPDVEFPTIEVSVTYPGADPKTIANNVVTPLEQQFTTIDGIQTISSTSMTGTATILLEFNLSRSIDAASTDVLAAINASSAQLPADLPYTPSYSKANPTATPILFFAISSDTMTQSDLYTYAHTVIGQRLNIVEGVSEVETFGSPFAVRVQVDPQKLASRGIGLGELAQTVREANVYMPTGTLFGPEKEFTIDCAGQLTKAEQYQSLIVKNQDGQITRLSDVATAYDSLWTDKTYVHFLNKELNQPMVGLAVQKLPGSNTLDIIHRINEMLPDLIEEMPQSLHVWRMFDVSEYIDESVRDVQTTLVLALLLVVVVIFLYLGELANTLIPSLAIPMSVLGTFIVMHLLGFTLDMLSLMAITLSIGFLVDDAIVVLENIARFVEKGKPPMQAALDGSKQISLTILTMTLCLCTVFIPLIFMEGIIGRLLHEFAMTIVTAVLISGLISLTFTPMLCSRFIASSKLDGRKKNPIERFSIYFNELILKVYRPSLRWCLHHQKTILGGGFLCLGATLFLLVYLPKDFFPQGDIGFIQGFAQAPDGTSPYKTAEVAQQIESIAIKNRAVDKMVTIAAVEQDNQTLFYFKLVDINQRPPTSVVIQELQEAIGKEVVGIQLFLKPLPLINLQVGAEAVKAEYQYTLQSLNTHDLYSSATKLEEKLKTLPQFTTVTSDLDISQPNLHIEIERDKASVYNISARQIEGALELAFAEVNLSPINEADNQYYVIMETLPKFYKDPRMLDQLWLRAESGDMVPFSEIVNMTESVGPLTVNHVNGLPSATLSFNLASGVPLQTALDAIKDTSKKELPPTVFGKVEGAANIFEKSFANLTFLLIVTIFIIYIVLGILYENFFHPLTVMSTLPPAALGGLLILVLFGYDLSIYPFVGIIMLLGIVMKNGIILVDFANEKVEKEGKSAEESIFEACCIRLRPILMTTFAALMGSVPIALGIGGLTAKSRQPLGVVIVGGLLISQILTLYLTPVIYLYIERLREYLHHKFTRADETP